MASSIVTSTAQQLGGLLVNEAKYLYEVSDQIERLQRDLQWMQCFLEDADNRQNREKVVAIWVAEIRDFAYEAEEIIEKYVYKVSHPRQNGGWNTIKWFMCALYDARALHEVGSNIDDLRKRITDLMPRLQLYGVKVTKEEETLAYSYSMREQRQSYSYIEEDPVGLKIHTRTVVEQLTKNQQIKIVGICGMGGLGKTTLASQVFQDPSTKEYFRNNRAWVCISKQFKKRLVLREILEELTNMKGGQERMDISNCTDGDLSQRICQILKRQNCLVVLDDIWNDAAWDVLEPAFQSIKTSGSKILITTRNYGLMEHIDLFGYIHNPDLLDHEDSWELFRRKTFPGRVTTEDSATFEEIESDQTRQQGGDMKSKEKLGREMLKYCKGLPLAIITLGGVLRNKKTFAEWEIVQKNITSYLMGNMEQGRDNNGLYAIMELSYKDLPFYLKPCFMYLGNFPEDYEISTHRLYHLWEAEGLVTIPTDDRDEIEEVRLDDIAESYLIELVERSLVQVGKCWKNGRITSCRLHDVMRDMCLKKCKEVNFLSILKDGPSVKQSGKVASSSNKLRRCAFYLRDKNASGYMPFDPTQNTPPCIRALLFFQDYEVLGSETLFAPNMSYFLSLLRILDLQDTGIPLHPKTTKAFIHLRYLSFKCSLYFSSLPKYIWECKYLETLDLRWGYKGVVKVSNMFWKLERLRHLYLPYDMELESSKLGRRLILTDTQLQQMETFKLFDVNFCQMEDLEKMTSMRVFTFAESNKYYFGKEEVEHLLNSRLIATNLLAKPMRLSIEANAIDKETSTLLSAIQSHACFGGLNIKGKIETISVLENFHTLTRLYLINTEIGQDGISVLEKNPHLEDLTLQGETFSGTKLSFSNGGFLQLYKLDLCYLVDLEEWEIGQGALPKLKELRTLGCGKLKMIPDGLPMSVYVKCTEPCINGVEKYNICPNIGGPISTFA